MAASEFLARRNQLLLVLSSIDSEISQALRWRKSQRAADRAKKLFQDRELVVTELAAFGVDVEQHPAVWSKEFERG